MNTLFYVYAGVGGFAALMALGLHFSPQLDKVIAWFDKKIESKKEPFSI